MKDLDDSIAASVDAPPAKDPVRELNPVLKRVLDDVQRAKQSGSAITASHSSYVVGVFEKESK